MGDCPIRAVYILGIIESPPRESKTVHMSDNRRALRFCELYTRQRGVGVLQLTMKMSFLLHELLLSLTWSSKNSTHKLSFYKLATI